MAERTEIAWCDSTFNPWIGCAKVSPACDHCYAERWGHRFGVELPEGERRVLAAVIEFYPDAATKAEIDQSTGYKRSSRDTYIQRLRARALVVNADDGVRAADTLFGEGNG